MYEIEKITILEYYPKVFTTIMLRTIFELYGKMKVLYEAGVGLQKITEMSVFDRVARLKYAEKIEDVDKILEEVRG